MIETSALARTWAGNTPYEPEQWQAYLDRFDSEQAAVTFRETVESQVGMRVSPAVLRLAHAAARRSRVRDADAGDSDRKDMQPGQD